MEAVPLTDAGRDEWDAFVAGAANGAPYHLTVWRDVVRGSYGWKDEYRFIKAEGRTVGVLPLFRTRSLTGRRSLCSVPYAPYGGLVADGRLRTADVLRACGFQDETVVMREARFGRDYDGSDAVTMVRALPGDAAELWKDVGPKVRNQVRKAEKAGIVFAAGTEHYEDVLEVYARNMKRLGTPVHRPAFYRLLKDGFGGMLRVWAVLKDGRAVGGMVAIGFNGTMNDYVASVLTEYNRDCPNMLLYWKALEASIADGFERFDFGRSIVGQGTYRFKKQWGAEPVTLAYTRLYGGAVVPAGPPRANAVTRLWSRLPDAVTDRLGPVLRKYVV